MSDVIAGAAVTAAPLRHALADHRRHRARPHHRLCRPRQPQHRDSLHPAGIRFRSGLEGHHPVGLLLELRGVPDPVGLADRQVRRAAGLFGCRDLVVVLDRDDGGGAGRHVADRPAADARCRRSAGRALRRQGGEPMVSAPGAGLRRQHCRHRPAAWLGAVAAHHHRADRLQRLAHGVRGDRRRRRGLGVAVAHAVPDAAPVETSAGGRTRLYRGDKRRRRARVAMP